MKIRFFALGCAAIGCALAVALPGGAAAAIDDQQFNELKDLITKLGQKVEKQDQRIELLEKTHAQDAQAHEQDQKTHEQDQQKIKELEQKLGETQRTVSDVEQKADSRTFQRSRLALELSIFDNIMIGNHKRLTQGLFFNLLRRGSFKSEFERGYRAARALLEVFDPELAQRMFEPVHGLPMIERRRIEICRALVSAPKLLLLDEPSAGMTHDETSRLMHDILQVRERAKDLTIIIVEHAMGVIERITDRCVVLNFGRKIAEGPYRQVADDGQVQEAYLGAAP